MLDLAEKLWAGRWCRSGRVEWASGGGSGGEGGGCGLLVVAKGGILSLRGVKPNGRHHALGE